MNRSSLISILFLFLFSCSQPGKVVPDSVKPEKQDVGYSSDEEGDLDSRIMYEYMRLRNPYTGKIPGNMREKELAFAQTLPKNMTKSFTWNLNGPVNKGGRTRAIALDVLNENTWLAAGVTGGIWRSVDAGGSWEKVTAPAQMHSFTSLAQDTRPGHENTWYAGTGEHYGIVSASTFEARFSGNGMLKSTDNGLTWTELPSTQSNSPETFLQNHQMDFIWRIVTDHTNTTEDVVLAAVYNGVTRSNDGGATWTEVLGFLQGPASNPHSDYTDLIITPGGILYASISSDGPSKGMFRSDDGGITWTNIIPSAFPTSYGRMAMAYNPQNENEIWYFGDTNGPYGNGHSVFKYTYISGDGSGSGGTWEDRSINLPNQSCYVNEIAFELGLLNTQSSFDVHIAVHPNDPDVIFIAGTSIWRTTDAFTTNSNLTWIGGYKCDTLPYNDVNWQLSYENHHPDQHYMTFLPSDPKVLINVNDGGIYKTIDDLADTVKWVPLNNGYVTTQFYAVAMEPGETNSDIVIGGMQDNGTWFTNTTELDSAWVEVGGGDGMYCAITENAEFYIVCSQNGKMYLKQVDGDGNVLGHERIDPEAGPSTYNWANSLKLDPNNTNRLYWNGRTRLWRLDDLHDITISGDKTNKEPDFWVNITESQVLAGAGVISDIELSKDGADQVWYGTSQGHLYRLDNASTSTPVKVNLTSPDFPYGSWISSIAVDPFDSDKILVTFANYEVPSIFYSKDGGATWSDIGGNLEENLDGSGSGPAVLWAENYPNGTLFVGTTVGLFTTNHPDSSNTIWSLEAQIGNVVINHMDYRTYDGKMIVGTHGNGVYSTHLTPAFASTGSSLTTNEFRLYPTMAQSQITVEGNNITSLEVFDLQGKSVFSGLLNSGKNVIAVEHFTPGVYVAVVYEGDKRTVKKFVKN